MLRAALVCALIFGRQRCEANPQGMQVVSGTAQAVQNGSQLNISVSRNAFLNWSSFNIGRGETTVFQQPNAASVVWNRIGDANASQIYGSLRANGVVILANQAGFYFGPESFVQAGGLYVTTAPISPGATAPGSFSFDGPPPTIPIINYVRLETSTGGSLFLIAKQIENHGTLSAPGGSVGLIGAENVMISDRPDGRGLSAKVTLPAGTVENRGQILADAGRVLMQAKTVNQGGLVQANSIREKNGVIELFASENLELTAQSRLEAGGGAVGASDGGRIVLKSDGQYKDESGSIVSAAGGIHGGNGGHVEISADSMRAIRSQVGAQAAAGGKSGSLLIDPKDIILSSDGAGSAGNGTVGAPDLPDTLNLNVDSAFSGFSSISLQARNNITVKAGTVWDLPTATGKDEASSKLTLQAGNNLALENGASILGGQNWSFDFTAGYNLAAGQGAVVDTGSLTLAGAATLQTGAGSINILAGNAVSVSGGAIRTVGGGSISVTALGGNVDTGSNPHGFVYGTTGVGYAVSTDVGTGLSDLGGISTAHGGNVHIQAKKEIRSFLPPSGGTANSLGDAGTGAFGSEPGNVTLEAGGNITGHYVVRNGDGKIDAKGNAGTTSRSLALSLVKGSWAVAASDSIVLQEVRNPNGMFNIARGDNPFKLAFDYDVNAAVSLSAGNGVTLSGALLPRAAGYAAVAPIYAPQLTINADSGGVLLANNVSLFPSAVGSLSVKTTGGGNLRTGTEGQSKSLVVSDSNNRKLSGSTDFTSADRGANDLHADDLKPVTLDVSGSILGIDLVSPKRVSIQAGADIVNTSISAQNFRPGEQSTIVAGGRIAYQNIFTTLNLGLNAVDPPFEILARATDQVAAGLADKFVYDAANKTLVFAGRLTDAQRDALLNAQVLNVDGTLSPVNFLDADKINNLYTTSQKAPSSPSGGISIAGPGELVLQAASIDLGASHGVVSTGFAGNPTLVPHTSQGAAIIITVAGDLNLFSTQITSLYGGDILIHSGGNITLGSRQFLGENDFPRGIISLWGADIDIIARNNVDVSGSRVAAYDGGSIHILSESGNVDAGLGGNGYVVLQKTYFDASLGTVESLFNTIPGSGILATTFSSLVPGESSQRLGSIKIETPRGNIIANAGGIVQSAFGPIGNTDAAITLKAGSKDADGTIHLGNIESGRSGVIGKKITLDATGDIKGLIIAQGDLSISALQNVAVTAIGQAAVNIKSDSGTVSGTIVGTGNVSVSGSSITANVVTGPGQANISGSVNTPAAPAAPANNANQADAKKVEEVASTSKDTGSDDEDTRRKKPLLTKKRMSRVTVLLRKT